MLSRCLAAGPSRALLLRRFASAAASEAPSPAPHPPPSPSPSTPSFAPSLTEIERLVSRFKKRPSAKMRKSLWEVYSSLSPVERSSLSPEYLRTILRAIVPRHDEAWTAVQSSTPRNRKKLNDQQAEAWGRKLRAVISEMVDRGIDQRRDWQFILQCLLKVGAVSAVEAVWKSLPRDLQADREFAELRLGVVIRYAKNARAAARAPDKDELDLAYNAFWAAFQTFQNPDIKTVPITNRLLVVASSEFAGLMKRAGNEDAFQSFHQVLRFVLEHTYGLDIDNISLSMERRAEERASGATGDKYRDISPTVLNAILDHLRQQGSSPYGLLATFDVLTNEATRPSVSVNMREFGDEEDDDWSTPPSSMPPVEEQAGEQRNWFGWRRASYFEPTAPGRPADVTSSAADATSSAPEPVSRRADAPRSVSDYLPQPIWPRDVVPDPSLPLPKRQPYNPDTVLILLQAAGQEGEWGLMQRILELIVADSLERDGAWLAAYLACPADARMKLVRPARISPEWFASVLGEYTAFYDRHAPRTVHVLERVIAWTQQKIDVVVAAETARGGHEVVDGRVVLPPPDVEARKLRFLRNDSIFLPADELQRLYRDQDEFAGYLARALALTARRAGRYAVVHERQRERQEAEASGRDDAEVDGAADTASSAFRYQVRVAPA